jgi:general secretion pathway protein K
VLPGLELGDAQRMVTQRASSHFSTVGDAIKASGLPADTVDTQLLDVGSHFFTVRGRLRLGDTTVQEVSLVERQGRDIRVLWRQREALANTTVSAALSAPTSLQ